MTLAHQRRPRAGLRRLLLALGLVLISAGYWSLAVDPDTQADIATRRAFLGMGLVVVGTATALISRWI